MTRRRKQILILAAIVVALAAMVMMLGPAPAQAAEPPTSSSLSWKPCERDGAAEIGMECATLEVPVDWDDPEGRQIELVVGRLAATGPEPAEGSVVVNFGGPGPSGIELLQNYPGPSEPYAELRETMNIVTWDPRGYGQVFLGGRSTALECDWREIVLPRTPPYPRSQAELDQLAADNRARLEPCHAKDPELFANMDSASNARDLEAIRQALGEGQLNYHGNSYGGVVGQAYARLFPEHIRTMAVDGTGNQSTDDWDAELDAIARDNEATFQRFVDWCETSAYCALHGSDVTGRWQALTASADETPVPATEAGVRYTGRELRHLGHGMSRRGREGWGALATAVKAAERGDASGFIPEQPSPYPTVGTPGVTECLEFPRYEDYEELESTVARLREVAPNTGASFPLIAHLATTCGGWPAPVNNPPAPLPEDVPPLLGAGTWWDFGGTERMTEQVPGSVAIFHDGPGHALYHSGNACVIEHVNRYFTTTELPPPGTEC